MSRLEKEGFDRPSAAAQQFQHINQTHELPRGHDRNADTSLRMTHCGQTRSRRQVGQDVQVDDRNQNSSRSNRRNRRTNFADCSSSSTDSSDGESTSDANRNFQRQARSRRRAHVITNSGRRFHSPNLDRNDRHHPVARDSGNRHTYSQNS